MPKPKLIFTEYHPICASDVPYAAELIDCGAPGDASEAVAYYRSIVDVQADEADAISFLLSTGGWTEGQLQDHDENLNRLVWIAGCDLREVGEICFGKV